MNIRDLHIELCDANGRAQALTQRVEELEGSNRALRSNLRETLKIVSLMHSAHPLPLRCDIPGKLRVMIEGLLDDKPDVSRETKRVPCNGYGCSERRIHHERPDEPRGVQMLTVPIDYEGPAYCSITCHLLRPESER